MSVSVTQICNLALLKYGDVTINDIGDDNPQAIACRVLYPLMRDEIVSAHEWNFAMKRADLGAPLSDTPAFEFDFAYQLPVDCLRVWEFYSTGTTDPEWVREGNKFLTNQEEDIFIRYIKKVTATGDIPAAVTNCIAIRLAAELAVKIKEDKVMRRELLAELEQVWLPEAMRLNAIEGRKPKRRDEQSLDNGNLSWQKVGR